MGVRLLPPVLPHQGTRPAAAKPLSKRDAIVALFLDHDDSASADQLFEAMRSRDPRVGRATVYRTLQWMVETGLARKVDFGDGRVHFEHGVPRPRHLHLVCDTCGRAWEAPGGEAERVIAVAASERRFEVTRTTVEVHGTCESCRHRTSGATTDPPAEAVVLRDVLRATINEAHGESTFYAKVAGHARDTRLRAILARIADDVRERVASLETELRGRLASDPWLESRPTQVFLKTGATASFAAATSELDRIDADRDRLTLAIRCERSAHRSLKRHQKRVAAGEAQRVLLEAVDRQRARLDHLLREYRTLGREATRVGRPPRPASPARGRRVARGLP